MNKFNPGKFDDILETLANVQGAINKAINVLNTVKDSLANGGTPDLSLLNNVIAFTNDVSNITNNLYNNFDENITNKINSIFDDAYNVAGNVVTVLKEAQNKLPQVTDIMNTVYEGADKGY